MGSYGPGEDGQRWLGGDRVERNSETERKRQTSGDDAQPERRRNGDGDWREGGNQTAASWWPAKVAHAQGRGESEWYR
ncbi:hypothetical protein NL676_008532 [Syzygium grande]|nr:hypothetical protein NL676_008532 [Syzygium grande]